MPIYVLPQYPDHAFETQISDKRKSILEATYQLVELIDSKTLKPDVLQEFTSNDFIEITENDLMPSNKDELERAVKVIGSLSIAKRTAEKLKKPAIDAYTNIGLLFSEKELSEDEFSKLKSDLKLIRDFALAHARYTELIQESEKARSSLKTIFDAVKD